MTTPQLTEGIRPRLEHCRDCKRRWLVQRGFCPSCGSSETEMKDVSGVATVQAVTTVHRSVQPSAIGPAPYCIVLVQLEAVPDVRIMALAETAPAIGGKVQVTRHGQTGAPYLVTSEPTGTFG
ncbi:MAG: OB-fold domain-containing protein [Ectothiorhodospiraceae bacterium]|nr:OB-fold domain-containing protein [Ectothiorhodospiraceae bacterium]MCH8505672.1 OB-fold domain-containing protein [Ectothiorhodospiraceae bacterium]